MADQRVLDLMSGVITAHWLTLELLDRSGVLPKAQAVAYFEDALSEMGPELAEGVLSFPVRQLVKALSRPAIPDRPSQWRPVVIHGGKDDEL